MKRFSVVLNVLFVVAAAAWFALGHLLGAINRGKCQGPGVATIVTIVSVLDSYHEEHGRFPEAMSAEGLRAKVEPKYIKLSRWSGIGYASDGLHYDLSFSWCIEGPVEDCHHCDLRVRDGAWVASRAQVVASSGLTACEPPLEWRVDTVAWRRRTAAASAAAMRWRPGRTRPRLDSWLGGFRSADAQGFK